MPDDLAHPDPTIAATATRLATLLTGGGDGLRDLFVTSAREPLTREAENLGRRELRQFLVADVEVGGDALVLFVILELLHQLQHLLCRVT